MNTIQERIKYAIEKSGLSYRQLAEKLGLSSTSVYRYVHQDVNKVPLSVIEKIAEITGTKAEWLMCWDDEPQQDNKIDPQLAALFSSLSEEEVDKTIEYIKFVQSQRK